MSGFGCSCGRCKFLSESAGKRRNPGRFPIAGTTVTVTKVPVPTKSAEINKADTKKQKSSEEKKNSDSKISAEETVTSTENKRETYVIRPGDTLYQISLNRYGTVEAMEQICALNGISANEIIYPGQVIVLP